eukprot:gene11501-4665_t
MSLFLCLGFSDGEEESGGNSKTNKPKKYGKILEKLPLEKIASEEDSITSCCYRYINPELKPVTCVTCTDCGRYIGFGYGPFIKILDLWSENIISVYQLHQDNTHCMHFSKNNVLYSGTVSGHIIKLTLDNKSEEIQKTLYGISGITTSFDSKLLLYLTTDMKMSLINLENKMECDVLGKATSVDAITFVEDEILTTSAEHIFHKFELNGTLKSAETPVKEVSFYNGRSFMFNSWSQRGLLVADKREDRKGNLTYVWEVLTKNLICRVKSFESTFMVSIGDSLIFDNEDKIMIHKIIKDENEIIKLDEEIMSLYSSNFYFLSASLDGALNIYFLKNIGNILFNNILSLSTNTLSEKKNMSSSSSGSINNNSSTQIVDLNFNFI